MSQKEMQVDLSGERAGLFAVLSDTAADAEETRNPSSLLNIGKIARGKPHPIRKGEVSWLATFPGSPNDPTQSGQRLWGQNTQGSDPFARQQRRGISRKPPRLPPFLFNQSKQD